MRKIQRALIGTAAVAGAFAAGFAIISATNDTPPVGPSLVQPGVPDEVLSSKVGISDTGGGVVAYADVSATVEARDGKSSDVCVTLQTKDGSGRRCYSASLISRGLAYTSLGDHDDKFVTIGIVPDEVSRLTMAGTDVRIENNIWTYTGQPPGQGSAMEIFAQDGRTLLKVDSDDFDQEKVPTTTTVPPSD